MEPSQVHSGPLPQLPMERLIRLEIAGVRHQMMLDTIRGLVMPNLEDLEIHDIFNSTEFSRGSGWDMFLPSLQRFVLQECNEIIVWNLIAYWTMPNLLSAHLDFSKCHVQLINELSKFVS